MDLIFGSIPEKHTLCDVAKMTLCDHYMVYTCIDLDSKITKDKTVRSRDFKTFNDDAFLNDIKCSPIFNKYEGGNIENESLLTYGVTGFYE